MTPASADLMLKTGRHSERLRGPDHLPTLGASKQNIDLALGKVS